MGIKSDAWNGFSVLSIQCTEDSWAALNQKDSVVRGLEHDMKEKLTEIWPLSSPVYCGTAERTDRASSWSCTGKGQGNRQKQQRKFSLNRRKKSPQWTWSSTRTVGPASSSNLHPRDSQTDHQHRQDQSKSCLEQELDCRLTTPQLQQLEGSRIWFIHRLSFRNSVHKLKISKTGEKHSDEGHVKLCFLSGVHFPYIMQQRGDFSRKKTTFRFSKRCKKYLQCFAPWKWNRKTSATLVMVFCRILYIYII